MRMGAVQKVDKIHMYLVDFCVICRYMSVKIFQEGNAPCSTESLVLLSGPYTPPSSSATLACGAYL